MDTERRVQQLFVRRRGGRIELSWVLEDPAGARFRETLPTMDTAADAAVGTAARHLARRGDVVGAPKLRVRVEGNGTLTDAPELARAFRRAWRAERDRT